MVGLIYCTIQEDDSIAVGCKMCKIISVNHISIFWFRVYINKFICVLFPNDFLFLYLYKGPV